MPDYSLADIAAATGNGGNGNGNNGGFGDGQSAWWLLVLFALLGGFGNNGNRNGGGGGQGGGYPMYGAGFAGGNELYPWLNQADQINDGFRDQMIQTNIQGIQQGINSLSTQLCNCCGDIQMALCNGFAGVEQGANARQMANMNQMFAAQTATMQGFNDVQGALCNGFNATQNAINQGFNGTQMGMLQGFNNIQSQFADCCCENRLGLANLTNTVLTENCADRAALSDGVRDIIQSQTAGTQRILDQLCQDKIDAKNEEIANLRQQLNMQNLAASQIAQTAQIQAGQVAEVDALYSRLRDCPVPTMPVYGMQPIFTCPQNQYGNCGCGCNNGCGCN